MSASCEAAIKSKEEMQAALDRAVAAREGAEKNAAETAAALEEVKAALKDAEAAAAAAGEKAAEGSKEPEAENASLRAKLRGVSVDSPEIAVAGTEHGPDLWA